jgi:hypothetical protein
VQRHSILGTISWGVGLTLLAYLAFSIRVVVVEGRQKAVGIGAFLLIFYSPWFWATVILVFAVVLLLRLR